MMLSRLALAALLALVSCGRPAYAQAPDTLTLKGVVVVDPAGKEWVIGLPAAPAPVPDPPPDPVPDPPPPAALPFAAAGAAFATLQAAHDALPPAGGAIAVAAGTFDKGECSLYAVKPLAVTGAGDGRDDGPATRCVGGAIQGKATIVHDAALTVAGIHFSRVTVPDGNGAPIRQQRGADLTVRLATLAQSENGLLTGAGGAIVLDRVIVSGNGGGDGSTHGIYVGAAASLSVTGGVHTGTRIGHDLKSRARVNAIAGTQLGNGTATESYNLDLPHAGTATVTDTVLRSGPDTDNNTMLAWGAEGTWNPGDMALSRVRFVSTNPAAVAMRNYTDGGVIVGVDVDLDGTFANIVFGPVCLTNWRRNGVAQPDLVFATTRARCGLAAQPPPPEPAPPPDPVPVPPPQAGDWPLAQLAAGLSGWRAIPMANRFQDVWPAAAGHPGWAGGPAQVVRAWSGGAWGRRALYVFGGGHSDYGGNEVYRLDFETLLFERLTDPSAYVPGSYAPGPARTADGTPPATHTYDGMVYLPERHAVMVLGGAPWSESGGATAEAWIFDIAARTWARAENTVGSWHAADRDPATGIVITSAYRRLFTHGPDGKVIGRTGESWSQWDVAGAWLPPERMFLVPFEESSAGSRCLVWHLPDLRATNPNGSTICRYWNADGSARIALPGWNRYGYAWHPPTRSVAAWRGDGDVYLIRLAGRGTDGAYDFRVTKLAPPAGQAVPDEVNATSGGVYGRWVWVEEIDAFVGWQKWDGQPWLYKPPASIPPSGGGS